MARTSLTQNDEARGALHLSGISKTFDDATVVDKVSLSVGAGEVLALVGPSGAGKTTLCRIIAGLEPPSAGACSLDGEDMAVRPPGERQIALMFESYALYPHLTVRQNVESPLLARAKGNLGREAQERIDQILTMLEIAQLADRHPDALSGGQKQRAALARALVQTPKALLLDEPISHLDAKLRHKLRGEIRRRLSQRDHPTVWSTPDGLEGLSVGDRVAVLDRGRLEQIGTPEDIWLRPASTRVAKLFGDPPMNILSGELHGKGARTFFRNPAVEIELPSALAQSAAKINGNGAFLGLRPAELVLSPAGAAGSTLAQVYSNEAFGKSSIITLRIGTGDLVKIKAKQHEALTIGENVGFECGAGGFYLFDGSTGLSVQ